MNLSVRSSCLQAHRFSWLNQSALIMWAASSATARPTRHPRRWLRYTVRATVLVGTWTRLSAHKSCQCRRRFLYGWPRAPFAHLPSGWPVPLLESCLSQTQASSSGLGCNHRRLMGGPTGYRRTPEPPHVANGCFSHFIDNTKVFMVRAVITCAFFLLSALTVSPGQKED